jgi:hypothetical protein
MEKNHARWPLRLIGALIVVGWLARHCLPPALKAVQQLGAEVDHQMGDLDEALSAGQALFETEDGAQLLAVNIQTSSERRVMLLRWESSPQVLDAGVQLVSARLCEKGRAIEAFKKYESVVVACVASQRTELGPFRSQKHAVLDFCVIGKDLPANDAHSLVSDAFFEELDE